MASLNTRMKRQAEKEAKAKLRGGRLVTAGAAGDANAKAVSIRVVTLFAQRDEIDARIDGYRRAFPAIVGDVERLAAEIRTKRSPIIRPADAPLIQHA